MQTNSHVNAPQSENLIETPAKTGVSKRLPIRKPLNLPAQGENSGIFLDVNILPEDVGPDKKARQLLKLDVQLDARDIHGNPFVVSKCYNLYARGLNLLSQDLFDWCGQDLIPSYAEQFDAGVILNRPVRVTINNRKQGKQWLSTIAGFHPAESETQPAPSAA